MTIDKAIDWFKHLSPNDQWQWIAMGVILAAVAVTRKGR